MKIQITITEIDFIDGRYVVNYVFNLGKKTYKDTVFVEEENFSEEEVWEEIEKKVRKTIKRELGLQKIVNKSREIEISLKI